MKFICIGRNYIAHSLELGNTPPKSPIIFLKPDTALLKKDQELYLPEFSENIHYELEVCVRISKPGKHINEEFAHRYYEDITLGLDLTARDLQTEFKAKGLPWDLAKGFDGSAVLGKWISKENFDLNNLNFHLNKNGETVQNGNTRDMIFSINQILCYVSRFFSLRTGDILFTGTPAGVGTLSTGDHLLGILEGQELLKLRVH